jgi:hypothetical protein
MQVLKTHNAVKTAILCAAFSLLCGIAYGFIDGEAPVTVLQKSWITFAETLGLGGTAYSVYLLIQQRFAQALIIFLAGLWISAGVLVGSQYIL